MRLTRIKTWILLVMIVFIVTSCAPGSANFTVEPAGFFMGLWHGLFHYSLLLLACLVIVLRFMKPTIMEAGTTLALSWEFLYSMVVAQRVLAEGKEE